MDPITYSKIRMCVCVCVTFLLRLCGSEYPGYHGQQVLMGGANRLAGEMDQVCEEQKADDRILAAVSKVTDVFKVTGPQLLLTNLFLHVHLFPDLTKSLIL